MTTNHIKSNLFNEDDSCKDTLREALDVIRRLRAAYCNLHAEVRDLVDSGRNLTFETEAVVADMLEVCFRTDQDAAEFLNSIPENNRHL